MKIAVIAAPFVEIPPKGYGGTERILNYMADEFFSRGSNVVFFASGDSDISLPLRPIVDVALFNDKNYDHSIQRKEKMKEINTTTLRLLQEETFDIISLHDYDNPDLVEQLSKLNIPVLITIRHAMTPLIKEVYEQFKNHPNIFFCCLTKTQSKDFDRQLPTISDGLNQKLFAPQNLPKRNYFFSIGDMKPIKGNKRAIELAKKSGVDLIIAGAPYYPESKKYFEETILPHIDIDASKNQEEFLESIRSGDYQGGKGDIIYFGTANDSQKRILFGHAKFSQFLGNLEVKGNIDACPGTVLESIMLGTAALGVKGSVTEELIDEGITGYTTNSIDEAISLLPQVDLLTEERIRAKALERFSSKKMVSEQLNLCKTIIEQWKHSQLQNQPLLMK